MKNDLMNLPELRTGDVVFFADSSWLSKAIRWFQPGPSKASHVGIIFEAMGNVGLICEALGRVVIQPVRPRLEEKGWREIWRFDWVTDADVEFIQRKCREFEGRSYGWWKILFHAVGLQRLTNWSKYPVCSFLVASILNDLKKARTGDPSAQAFGVTRGSAQPDGMQDYCVAQMVVETGLVWYTERG